MLYTNPQNDREIGWNSSIILILKKLNFIDPNRAMFDEARRILRLSAQLSQTKLSEIFDAFSKQNRLLAIKIYKDAVFNCSLKDAKDDIYRLYEVIKEKIKFTDPVE